MRTAAIVPAAGRGVRLGSGPPKALREVAGEPLLVHAVRRLWQAAVDVVVVAAPAGTTDVVRDMLTAAVDGLRLEVVEGATTRQASVAAALAALQPDVEIVLVHDAARAFTPVDVVERVVASVRAGAPAVVPVIPVADTVKEVSGGVVRATVDRSRLRQVQTPQGFSRDVLVRAHADDATEGTDDATLVERLGLPVAVVDGSEQAFKVTRPVDLLVAEALLRGGS
ncbi:MAG: 2-C-methyl-D-erythritol 4-phosphate cytidylyltransferase [Nocardioidaceae bacterium]